MLEEIIYTTWDACSLAKFNLGMKIGEEYCVLLYFILFHRHKADSLMQCQESEMLRFNCLDLQSLKSSWAGVQTLSESGQAHAAAAELPIKQWETWRYESYRRWRNF